MGKSIKEKKVLHDDITKPLKNKKIVFKEEDCIDEETVSLKLPKTRKGKKRKPDKSGEGANNVDSSTDLKILADESSNESSSSDNVDGLTVKVTQNTKIKRNNDVNVTTKSKKIKSIDEAPKVVKMKMKDSNQKKQYNDDEEKVKDEDIDAFCDALDEKDNETYENWVKLFEDNFRSNKKKT